MYIDTHCHLTFPQYIDDLAMVIGNAKKAGVKKFICPGVDALSNKQTVDLSVKNSGVIFAALGYHPYETPHDPDLALIEKTINQSRLQAGRSDSKSQIVAIGECGLDYHLYKGENALGKKDKQKHLLFNQLVLAQKFNLPVILHVRDAFEDFFSVLDSLPTLPKGVVHCFTGGIQEVRFCKERRLSVGIDGNVTYGKQLWQIVPEIPLSMLLLETDSPYLTPLPHRGSRNEPKYIPLIAKKIAELHKVDDSEVKTQTTKNAISLFQLPL